MFAPTGKSISVSVRVVRAVRAVRAGGRGEAKLRGSVRAAMIPPNSEAAGPKSFLSSWRRRCPAGARCTGARCTGCSVHRVLSAPGARCTGCSVHRLGEARRGCVGA